MVTNNRASACAVAASAALLVAMALANELRAQPPQDIASQIPPSVSEVIVGGIWETGDSGGVYRAVLIYRVNDDAPVADIVVQWLRIGDDGPSIAHTETITSIRGEPATTAFVAFDFGESGETTRLLVGSYDPETDEDETQFVRLGGPAEFSFVSPGDPQPGE